MTALTSRRIDCETDEWPPRSGDSISITGRDANWTLDTLEVATHHGATRQYDLVILPASSHAYTRASVWAVLLTFVGIAAVLMIPRIGPGRRWARSLHRIGISSVAVLFTLVLLSAVVTHFLVLLSLRGFVVYVVVLLAAHLFSACRHVFRACRYVAARVAQTGRLASGSVATAIVVAVFGSVLFARLDQTYHGNYSGLIQISRQTFERNPLLKDRVDIRNSLVLSDGGGYDGQFLYYEVYDPFLRRFREQPSAYRAFIDAPPYRFGRIGYSLLTKVISGDSWPRYPATMVWLVFVSLVLCAALIAFIAAASGASPLWGVIVTLVPGFWSSLQSALPEPIAAATVLGGYLCAMHRRWYSAAALFALSLLIRETGVVVVVAVGLMALRTEQPLRVARFAVLAVGPVVLWKLYVGWVLFSDWGLQGFLFRPQDFDVPFRGIATMWRAIADGRYYAHVPELARAGLYYPVLLTIAAGFAIAYAIAIPSAASVAAVVYAAIAISLNYDSIWIHVGNAQRATFELFVMLALVSVDARAIKRVSVPLRLGLWIVVAAYVFFGGLDADFIRNAIV